MLPCLLGYSYAMILHVHLTVKLARANRLKRLIFSLGRTHYHNVRSFIMVKPVSAAIRALCAAADFILVQILALDLARCLTCMAPNEIEDSHACTKWLEPFWHANKVTGRARQAQSK